MENKVFGYILAFSAAFGFLGAGCENKTGEESHAEIAVTNSYLGCAVLELCSDDTEVLCLAPPGMCPGHFDISPLQVKQLCDCRMLLLFDFQKQVAGTLSRVKKRGLKTALVEETGGLCVPETYLAVCREVSDILSSEYPERKANHQADFVNWLGLETIATFVGSDIETVTGIDRCIRKAEGQDVRFVIANKQEGTAMAKALFQQLSGASWRGERFRYTTSSERRCITSSKRGRFP
jgi:hypothetical protein